MEQTSSRCESSAAQDRLSALFTKYRLSPTQRRIARQVIDNPHEAPFLSSVDLAASVGVSQPSVIRLSAALGYERYADFQKDLRQLVLKDAEDFDSKVAEADNKFQSAVAAEIHNLEALKGYLADPSTVVELGQDLAQSEPLCVLGLRVSTPPAAYFGYFAKKVHPDVRILTEGGSTTIDHLMHARHAGGDWVLCFLLPRHPRETLEAMSYAKSIGLRVATVTDNVRLSAELSDVVLQTDVGTQLVFDSQASAMVLAGVLLEAISDASPARTQDRLEDFEQRAAELKWFVTE
jgi:DNA-binding MurR/RpiR family transcriptional regulator